MLTKNGVAREGISMIIVTVTIKVLVFDSTLFLAFSNAYF